MTPPALPRRTLAAGTRLHRIHRRTRGPWFFDGSGAGRFDPVAAPGRGASYWALDPLGAWIDVFRGRMLLTDGDIADRCLSVCTLIDPLRVVDLAVARALRNGVTAALTGGGDYRDAQRLASDVQNTEPGIRWRLRHDLRGRSIGVVLFSEAGTAPPAGQRTIGPADLPSELIAQAGSLFGYEVLPAPA
ncbi:MAG: hypothetical protein ACR2MB_15790 [Acidimicrobiales bacterium]